MKVVYIAGEFRAPTEWGIYQNIRHAEKVALELWQNGYAVICPHKNTESFQGALPDSTWLKGCLEILRRCDTIFMLKGFRQSLGAMQEYKLAMELCLEVLYEESWEEGRDGYK